MQKVAAIYAKNQKLQIKVNQLKIKYLGKGDYHENSNIF